MSRLETLGTLPWDKYWAIAPFEGRSVVVLVLAVEKYLAAHKGAAYREVHEVHSCSVNKNRMMMMNLHLFQPHQADQMFDPSWVHL